jgi:hypothetical protein
MKQVHDTDARSLARMLDLDDSVESPSSGAPTDAELSAMFTHQLSAPLVSELKLPENSSFATFRNLLHHANPDPSLLEETKNFAKTNRASTDESIRTIATMLYYASVAAALTRGKRITELTDDQLKQGFGWAVAQSWINEDVRSLFKLALERVS